MFRYRDPAAADFGPGFVAAAPKDLIRNGDFATGNLHRWTTFTTPSGTLGYGHDPKVTAFDVTGSGAQNAAEFQVGQVGDVGTEEGGGLEQTIVTKAGTLDFTADIAAFTKQVNLEGGTFSVLLDGVTEDTVTIGVMAKQTVQRGQLAFETSVTAGSHTIEILITRDYTNGGKKGASPYEYVTNISAFQSRPQGPATAPLPSLHAFVAASAAFGVSAAGAAHHPGAEFAAPRQGLARPHIER